MLPDTTILAIEPITTAFPHFESDNVWDELEDGDWNLVCASESPDHMYTIRAATLNKLIQRLTTPPTVGYEANSPRCTPRMSLPTRALTRSLTRCLS